jgi:hypothetical protein
MISISISTSVNRRTPFATTAAAHPRAAISTLLAPVPRAYRPSHRFPPLGWMRPLEHHSEVRTLRYHPTLGISRGALLLRSIHPSA